MNAAKPMSQSRYTTYGAPSERRLLSRRLIPHTIALAAAFSFISALVLGAL
ncbi:hypothetical protein PYH37_005069 [Sinorhizobium numidicum]|uniref:Uncharacterized protein n=1 Tax=Sinorhizobium numidicum TaxID=680248 RepID=A0ABY8CXN0_9HYPH|nr:hypothetical protein [Sinorhizobium numidicum]WEX76740.1 hypothetical protein PYH37_005069 [Sinorhizobium numidicum]WEX83401.1 hypothetical protein PYH38_005781 [Sinorhizobium numidicum]